MVDLTQIKCEMLLDEEQHEQKQALVRKFPKFQTASHYVCQLTAGDMLFLPAGWFHEVRSLNSAAHEPSHPVGALNKCSAEGIAPQDSSKGQSVMGSSKRRRGAALGGGGWAGEQDQVEEVKERPGAGGGGKGGRGKSEGGQGRGGGGAGGGGGAAAAGGGDCGGGEGGGGHMAFNYWFHPPDVCEKGKHLKPYASAFWERKFAPFGVAYFWKRS